MMAFKALAAGALAAALAVSANVWLLAAGAPRFPSLAELPATPFALQDAVLAALGARALAADIAWIELLQYAAEGLPEVRDRTRYEHLQAMTLRVTRLDPAFHGAYLFGAGLLGWEADQPEQAAALLREGMRLDPGQKLYPLYLAALAFQKKGDQERMLGALEAVLAQPDAPGMLRPIVAAIYERRGDLVRALSLWEAVLDSEQDASEHPRAVKKLAELRARLRRKSPRR